MAVNRSATKRDDDDPITGWYDAVGSWNSKAPVAPSRRTSTKTDFPQPEEYYNPPPSNRSRSSGSNVTYYDEQGNVIRRKTTPPPQTYPQPRQSYSYPTSFDRSTNYGRDVPSRTGGTYTAPPPPPRSTYSVDPLKAAINKWQATTRPGESANDYDPLSSAYRPPQRTAYQVPEQQFDYGYEAPDTGASSFTSQQYQPPTRTTPTQPMTGPWQGPEEQPQGINAWMPQNLAVLNPGVLQFAANQVRDPEQRDRWLNLMQLGWQGVQEEVGDSAAYERAQFDINQRAQNFQERGGSATWRMW